ncbi:leucine ABC transporter subunit substrate-binding protein LivK, partial [Salmonella enterica subsp. enterica serovar Infantis]
KADKKDPCCPFVWITYASVHSMATAITRSAIHATLDLVKYLKANGSDTFIGPMKWVEKGDLKVFVFGVFQWNSDGS